MRRVLLLTQRAFASMGLDRSDGFIIVFPLLRSFFLGGFECSAHRRADGVRLDLLESTRHSELAREDYLQLSQLGINSVRDGVRWHLIEGRQGSYDWSSFLPMLRAANAVGTEVIWDLCHYGWPDHIDFFSSAFVDSFARFARRVATVVQDESADVPFYCPVNEVSYWAWAGGSVGRMNPCVQGDGARVKAQLVRAAIAAIHAIRDVEPRARFIIAEPLINVVSGPQDVESIEASRIYHESQYEVHDMLTGAACPELGGSPECLDIIGVNYYPDNQWYLHGNTIPLGHHSYRRLSSLLREVHDRYRRPILISETGAEGGAKAYWLHYVCGEVRKAQRDGLPIEGLCMYPIVDYPGWDNERVCNVGLLSVADENGTRKVCDELGTELQLQQFELVPSFQHTREFRERVKYG
jgi:beta-glucosidase/6-phospho-beta-glucosidase/beta-galactosidase